MKQLIFVATLALATVAHAAENRNLLVSTSWLQRRLLDRNIVVLDVGDRAAYEKAHVPGARFVALSDLVTSIDGTQNELPAPAAIESVFRAAGVRERDRIIIYSRDLIAAARAFFTLDYAGHGDRAAILDGGFAKWTAEGRPVEQGWPAERKPGDFQVRSRPETIVRMTALKTLVNCADWLGSSFLVIDSRSKEQYDAGRIVCAKNIPWPENLTSGPTPTFQSSENLKTLYSSAGAADDANFVTYCNSGMQASVTYFVLRYLGRDVHLYDGSYSEWSKSQ